MTRVARLLACLLACCLLVPAAAAASGRTVIRDCTDDEVLSKTYSKKDYSDALKQLGSDSDQYTNCRDVIRRAQLQAAGQSGSSKKEPSDTGSLSPGGGSGGGPSAPAPEKKRRQTPKQEAPAAPPTPAESQALDAARAEAQQPIAVDAAQLGVRPDGDADASVPGPVIALLVGLGLAAALVSVARVRTLVLRRSS